MALHLFPTPVECRNCGTVVEDRTTDHCPNCGKLLTERRTPSRLAGVERKYDNLRLFLGLVRFLAVITVLVGVLLFFFGSDTISLTSRALIVLGAVLIGSSLFLTAGLFDIFADLEENSRAEFRVLQSILEELQSNRPEP